MKMRDEPKIQPLLPLPGYCDDAEKAERLAFRDVVSLMQLRKEDWGEKSEGWIPTSMLAPAREMR